MTKLPPFKAREVVKGLQTLGFEKLSDILKQLGIDEDEFLQVVRRR